MEEIPGKASWCRKPLAREEIAEAMEDLAFGMMRNHWTDDGDSPGERRGARWWFAAMILRDSEEIEQRREWLGVYRNWWERW